MTHSVNYFNELSRSQPCYFLITIDRANEFFSENQT
jgi:hypothetical protein